MQPDNQFQPQPPTPPQPEYPPQPTVPTPAVDPMGTPSVPPAAPASPTIQPSSYQPAAPTPAPAPIGPDAMPAAGPTPQPQMTMTQPSTPMGGTMGTMPSQPQPAYQAASSQSSSGSGLGIAAMITALIPIIGLILGIVSVIKGSKTQNKKLKGLGIAAILLSIIMFCVSYFALPAIVSRLLGNNFSKTQEITASGTGYSFKVTIPEAFKLDANAGNASTKPSAFVKQEDRKIYAIYKNDDKAKGLIAMFGYQITDMRSLAKIAEAYGQKITPDSLVKDVLKDTSKIKDDIKKEKVFQGKINNVEVVSVEQDGNGILVTFTAKSETTDGKPADIVGELALYLNEDLVMIDTITFAKKEVWDANTDVFQGINKSISAQVNAVSKN